MPTPWLSRLNLITVVLAFSVIILGAYTRLIDAGLGCPDWPYCYGFFNAPSSVDEIAAANAQYPATPVTVTKARTEMTHRYFAEALGGFIIALAFMTYFKRQQSPQPLWLAFTLIALVMFQGMLGMWTVTLRLLPLAVVSHLLGGFCTLSVLWLFWLYSRKSLPAFKVPPSLLRLSMITLIVLFIQIFLGGWISSNYAALICPDFPTCQGQWWPVENIQHAFNLTGGLGMSDPLNYMDGSDRTTIHVIHRLGALVTLILGCALVYRLIRARQQSKDNIIQQKLRRYSLLLAHLLILQVALGIANVLLFLPLTIALAHNAVAALLLLTLVTIHFTLYRAKQAAPL